MTLRTGALVVAGILVIAAGAGILSGHFILWMFAIEAAVAGLLILFERSRYRARRSVAPGFEPTDEKFIDPVTGRETHVYFNPTTGERDYR